MHFSNLSMTPLLRNLTQYFGEISEVLMWV